MHAAGVAESFLSFFTGDARKRGQREERRPLNPAAIGARRRRVFPGTPGGVTTFECQSGVVTKLGAAVPRDAKRGVVRTECRFPQSPRAFLRETADRLRPCRRETGS